MNLNQVIELTSIRPGTAPQVIKETTLLAIQTQCRAIVLNYQDLGLAQKVKTSVNSSIKVVVIGNFPWMYQDWVDTVKYLDKDWDELDVLMPAQYYNITTKHDEVLSRFIDQLKINFKDKPIKLILETVWLRQAYKEYWQDKLRTLARYCYNHDLIIKTNSGLFPVHTFEELCEEIAIIRKTTRKSIIKAAGGIKTVEQVKKLISLRTDYIGTSNLELVKQLNEEK